MIVITSTRIFAAAGVVRIPELFGLKHGPWEVAPDFSGPSVTDRKAGTLSEESLRNHKRGT